MEWWKKILLLKAGANIYISKNFKIGEYACHDGTPYPFDLIEKNLIPHLRNMEIIREACGNRKIAIHSGYRTIKYNRLVGGVKKSQHILGKATDFHVVGMPIKMAYDIVVRLMKEGKIDKGGIGLYSGFIHYDNRGKMVLWKGK